MNDHLKNIEYIFPQDVSLNHFFQLRPEEPFSKDAISFLNALSILLRKDPLSNNFPEIATFAFFCRKASVLEQKKDYYPTNNRRVGRGIVFHISPPNTPLNFAYSLVSGILSGNLNIVRLPSKKNRQTDIILSAIKVLSGEPEFNLYTQRMLFIRYNKLNSASAYFSSVCDARIVWGGNEAIKEIKKNNLSDRAIDVTFGDKYSICIINADTYIHETSPKNVAQAFYNDTFLFDQQACTSPHLVVWLGSDVNVATSKKIFWDNLYEVAKQQYNLQAHSAIDKLVAFYHQAIHMDGIKRTPMPDNIIWRIELDKLSEKVEKYRGNCGYFVEYKAFSLLELAGIISNKHQTIACYGIEKENWDQLTFQNETQIMDRIKPIGKTSDFSLTWDGYNLIDTLSVPLQYSE